MKPFFIEVRTEVLGKFAKALYFMMARKEQDILDLWPEEKRKDLTITCASDMLHPHFIKINEYSLG